MYKPNIIDKKLKCHELPSLVAPFYALPTLLCNFFALIFHEDG